MSRRRYRLTIFSALVLTLLFYHGYISSSDGAGGPEAGRAAGTTTPGTSRYTADQPSEQPRAQVPLGHDSDRKKKAAPAVTAFTDGGHDSSSSGGGGGGSGSRGPPGQETLPRPARPANAVRWHRTPEFYPIPAKDLIPLPTGDPVVIPRVQHAFGPEAPADRARRERRLRAVRDEMAHAWAGYRRYGWMHDEVRPVSGGTKDPFCGWAASLVDSLDTLWIMGMRDDFDEAVRAVADIDFTYTDRDTLPVFETIIRYLGGLISAYDLSGRRILLDKAVELAEVLFGVFDTPNRMPILNYRWHPDTVSASPRRAGSVGVAEFGSMTLELTRLAQLTAERKYYDAAARVTNALAELQTSDRIRIPGLLPESLDASGCNATAAAEMAEQEKRRLREADDIKSDMPVPLSTSELNRQLLTHRSPAPPPVHGGGGGVGVVPGCVPQGLVPNSWSGQSFSIGAAQDSTYEYFPKQYLLLGGLEPKYKDMHLRTIEATKQNLLFRPMIEDESRDIRFPAKVVIGREMTDRYTRYEATHLGCFVGGMFALGGRIFNAPEDVELGGKLADGCAWAYEVMPAGIMADGAIMVPCADERACPWNESIWHAALDPQWRSRDESLNKWEQRQRQLVMEGDDASPAGAGTGGLPLDSRPVGHAEFVRGLISNGNLPGGFVTMEARYYILRPEAIESVWYMYRITGNPAWAEKGWRMFEAIIKATKTAHGHSATEDVTRPNPEPNDSMESFWMAETLKYFFLLFSEPDVLSLDEWVFNTEAHPFRRPVPAKKPKGRWGI